MSLQILDYSLSNFKIPGLSSYTPPFGTKKDEGSGLATIEIVRNEMMPFLKQRPINGIPIITGGDPPMGIVVEDSVAMPIEFNATFSIGPGISLQLDDPCFEGQEITVVASYESGDTSLLIVGMIGITNEIFIEAKTTLKLIAVNGKWEILKNNIVNNLTDPSPDKSLSAAMGKKLQDEKAPLESPALTGNPTVNGIKVANVDQVNAKADLASPNFSGTPKISGVAIANVDQVNAKADLASPNFSGTPKIAGSAIASLTLTLASVMGSTDLNHKYYESNVEHQVGWWINGAQIYKKTISTSTALTTSYKTLGTVASLIPGAVHIISAELTAISSAGGSSVLGAIPVSVIIAASNVNACAMQATTGTSYLTIYYLKN